MARFTYLVAFLLIVTGLFLAIDDASDARGPFNASGLGIAEVRGRPVLVEVFVALKSGANAEAEIRAALREHGARPLEKSEYTSTGLVWNQFSDGIPGNDYVTQYYNGANSPVGGSGLTALTNTHSTWTNVASSSAAFNYGGGTSRCPSLVQECPGDQTFDGFNDVAWLDLGRCNIFRCTLAVTWFSTSDPDEADMAMNTRVSWATNGSDYDAETVFLHENGHVMGLGHSNVTQAIMYAYYSGVRRTLHQDDIDGISALYPSGGGSTATPTATSTPVNTPTPTNTPNATPTATSTPAADTLHVGDLDGSGTSQGSTWTAVVVITVHDAGHNPVAGATVYGTFSWSGGSLAQSCTTNNGGQCAVTVGGIHKRYSPATFTVSSVTDTLTYDSGTNHDPDGDSDGTSIEVPKP